MSYYELTTSELENELMHLDDTIQSEEEGEPGHIISGTKSSPPAAPAAPDDPATNSTIQQNTVGLFGPGVSEFWVKKKTKHKLKRPRRGLTKGLQLPESVEKLLGRVQF